MEGKKEREKEKNTIHRSCFDAWKREIETLPGKNRKNPQIVLISQPYQNLWTKKKRTMKPHSHQEFPLLHQVKLLKKILILLQIPAGKSFLKGKGTHTHQNSQR